MGFAGTFIQLSIKFVCFVLIAWGGIICGKKYRDSKDARASIEGKESK